MLCHLCVFIKYVCTCASTVRCAVCIRARSHTCTANVRFVQCFVCVCRLWFDGLTDDDGGDLVPAGPVLVLDLADESGVDGVVHLPHRQLVAVHHHRVGQRAGGPAGEDGRTERIRRGGDLLR